MDSISKLVSRAQLRQALEKFRRTGGLRKRKPDPAAPATKQVPNVWWTMPRVKPVLN